MISFTCISKNAFDALYDQGGNVFPSQIEFPSGTATTAFPSDIEEDAITTATFTLPDGETVVTYSHGIVWVQGDQSGDFLPSLLTTFDLESESLLSNDGILMAADCADLGTVRAWERQENHMALRLSELRAQSPEKQREAVLPVSAVFRSQAGDGVSPLAQYALAS